MTSWNEIRKAATAFSKRWRNAFDEKSQAQSFLKEFFAVFGVDAVTVATFEHRVKFADGSQGYADCLWPGRILVEMKSRGKDLDAAFGQALEYVRSLPETSQTPQAIVVSDFARIRFYDLANDCATTSRSRSAPRSRSSTTTSRQSAFRAPTPRKPSLIMPPFKSGARTKANG